MGRKAISIEKDKLAIALKAAETNNNFANQSHLFKHLADQFGCAPVIIRSRILQFKLDMKTPKGKRGRSPGDGQGFVGQRKRKEKPTEYKEALQKVFKGFGVDKRVEAATKGSLKNAVALKCLDCAGSRKEVGVCTILSCSLWAYRPWKNQLTLTVKGREQIKAGLDKQEEE